MNVYQIEVEEILQEVYHIEANSREDAIEIVREKYQNEEIVLGPETIKETNFRGYEDGSIKDKSKKSEECYNLNFSEKSKRDYER